jgi:hypothetical protein
LRKSSAEHVLNFDPSTNMQSECSTKAPSAAKPCMSFIEASTKMALRMGQERAAQHRGASEQVAGLRGMPNYLRRTFQLMKKARHVADGDRGSSVR